MNRSVVDQGKRGAPAGAVKSTCATGTTQSATRRLQPLLMSSLFTSTDTTAARSTGPGQRNCKTKRFGYEDNLRHNRHYVFYCDFCIR